MNIQNNDTLVGTWALLAVYGAVAQRKGMVIIMSKDKKSSAPAMGLLIAWIALAVIGGVVATVC